MKLGGLNGTVTFRSGEYRPCTVDGKNALFRNWIPKEKVLMQFNTSLCHEVRDAVYREFIEYNLVPCGAHCEIVHQVLGIVEFEDGTVKEVEPEMITFQDSIDLFRETAFYTKGEI